MKVYPLGPNKKSDEAIIKFISGVIGNELSGISTPCYMSKIGRYFQDLKKYVDLTDKDIETYRMTISKEYRKFEFLKDPHTLLIVMCMWYFNSKGKKQIMKYFYQYLAIKTHASMMHIFFKRFCQPDIYSLTMDRISPAHKYKQMNGIAPTLLYWTDIEIERYNHWIGKTISDDKFVRMLESMRNKQKQSMRSFANKYYELSEQKQAGTLDVNDSKEAKSQLQADKIANIICTYGQIDKKAVERAVILSGLRRELGFTMVTETSIPEFKDKLNFIILLCNRIMDLGKIRTERNRVLLVKKIERGDVIGKYSPRNEIIKLIESTDSAYLFKNMKRAQLVMFYCHYLTLFIQSRIED